MTGDITRKKTAAYFTVEAAMILTLVTGVIVFLLYMMFFQYDRCLSDQDIGGLALKGCTVQAADKEELLQQLERYALQINMEKYIAWEQHKSDITLKENKVNVEQIGGLRFPFAGIVVGNADSIWEVRSVFENRRIDPVHFLRSYRKIMGGI